MKRASRVLRAASVWASFLLSSAHALAESIAAQTGQTAKVEADPGAQPGSAVEGSLSKVSPEEAATLAYQKALDSYSKGDIAAALDSMRQSYQLSKRPELLYNLAQLEEELKACHDSLEDYQRYLELVPHGRYREAAERARDRLEHECPPPATATAAIAPVATTPEPATIDDQPKQSPAEPATITYWTVPRVIGWSALATGAVAGASAVYFQLEAIQARDEFQHSVDRAAAGGPPIDTSLQDRQHRYNHLAIAFGIGGGVLVSSGALLLLLDPGNKQRSRSASLYALPGLVGASYAQRF